MWIPGYFRALAETIRAGMSEIKQALNEQNATINSAAEAYASERRDEPRIVVAAPTEKERETSTTERKKDRRVQKVIAAGTSVTAVATVAAAIGAGIYAHIAAKQAGIMSNTLTQIQSQTSDIHRQAVQSAAQTAILKTQVREAVRPWLKIELAPTSEEAPGKFSFTLTTGKDLVIAVRIKNIGKTPAEDVRSAFVIQLASHTDKLYLPPDMTNRPHVEHPKHWAGVNSVQSGAIFPDQFHDVPITYVGGCAVGRCGPIPIAQSELDQITSGKALVYLEGTATYRDGFGTQHWTRFCVSLPTTNNGQSACVQYNGADSTD